jgi:hypothetical protein
MSEKMEVLVLNNVYTKEQIVNEFVRKLPRTKLENIVKFVKIYNENQLKYSNTNLNEIVIDCIKNANTNS